MKSEGKRPRSSSEHYLAEARTAGVVAGRVMYSAARSFFQRIGVDGWSDLSLAEQCELSSRDRRIVGWLIVTGQLRATPDYIVRSGLHLGDLSARHNREFHERFTATAIELGFAPRVVQMQWSILAKIAAASGVPINRLTEQTIERGRTALTAAVVRHTTSRESATRLTNVLFGAATTLYHTGILNVAPRKRPSGRSASRDATWTAAPTELAESFQQYIGASRSRLRARSALNTRSSLREFLGWVTAHAAEVQCLADLRRSHIHDYEAYLCGRHSARGDRLSTATITMHLRTLRACLQYLDELGWELHAGLLVLPPRPPRDRSPKTYTVDKDKVARLMRAARQDDDPFVGLCVELIVRTGMSKSDLVDLTFDSIVRVADAYWIQGRPGTRRANRFVPLPDEVKNMLDTYLASRPRTRSPHVFVEYGRRISTSTVDHTIAKAERRAGTGHISFAALRRAAGTPSHGVSLARIQAGADSGDTTVVPVYREVPLPPELDRAVSVSTARSVVIHFPEVVGS